jgi:hypothetical protein
MTVDGIGRFIRSKNPTARGISVHSSVLNPSLWLTAVTLPLCLPFAYLFRDHLVVMTVLVGAGVVPVLLSCGSYIYFARTDPARLQSEHFQRWHEWFQAKQGKTMSELIEPAAQPAIENPAVLALPGQSTREG